MLILLKYQLESISNEEWRSKKKSDDNWEDEEMIKMRERIRRSLKKE